MFGLADTRCCHIYLLRLAWSDAQQSSGQILYVKQIAQRGTANGFNGISDLKKPYSADSTAGSA